MFKKRSDPSSFLFLGGTLLGGITGKAAVPLPTAYSTAGKLHLQCVLGEPIDDCYRTGAVEQKDCWDGNAR